MNSRLEFKKFFDSVDAAYPVGGVVDQQRSQIGDTNADWTKSQIGGIKGPIRSNYVAQMKKRMVRK